MSKGSNKLNRREALKLLGSAGLGIAIAETYERLYDIPLLERRFRKEVEYWLSQYNAAKEEINKLDELEKESTSDIAYYREKMDEAIDNLKRTIEKYRVILGDDRVAFESSTVKILEDLKLTQEKLQKVLSYFPLILNFAWKPTRIINDKIYDINVTFEVASPLNSLKEVEVMLIPKEYRYFITNYGMREEDYDKVFPKEEIRSIKIEPKKLEREMFSVDFEDLKGGREYIVKARVNDVAGNESIVEAKTPYIRQFENIAWADYIIVAVPYYLWYRPDLSNWKDGHKYTSLLGEYRSDDSIVHSKHIDWATGYGIDVFLVSWDGYNSNEDIQYFNNNLKLLFRNELSKDIKIAILYEGLKFKTTGNTQKPWERDISDPHNLEILLSDFKYLADNYFNDENYFRIEGKPVVYIYGSATYINTKDALEKLQEIMREKIGKEVFLISDHVTPHFFPGQKPEWEREARSFEGITSWLGGYSPSGEYLGGSYEVQIDKMYSEWFKWTLENKKLHMPSTTPEFDNRYVKWGNPASLPLERSPENFRKRLEIILKYTNYPRVIFLGTWNDFFESTTLEPTREYEFTYLKIIREIIGL
jgi:hypothetical protein